MSAITIDSGLVHYEVLGRGRPVLLIHGWLGSWRYWIPTMQQLSAKYRIYALDLWGFGDSQKNSGQYGLSGQVTLLAQFMEKLGITKAAIVGHSLGAAVAIEFARRNPDAAPRVMVISPPLFSANAAALISTSSTSSAGKPTAAVSLPSAATPSAMPSPLPTSPTAAPAVPEATPAPIAAPASSSASGATVPAVVAAPSAVAVTAPASPGATSSAPAIPQPNGPAPTTTPAATTPSVPSASAAPNPAPAATATPTPTPQPLSPTTSAPAGSTSTPAAPSSNPALTQDNASDTLRHNPFRSSPERMAQLYAAAAAAGVPVTAVATAKPTDPVTTSSAPPAAPQPNPLVERLNNVTAKALLERHLARSDDSFEKLRDEVEKTDEAVLMESARSFAGVNLAAALCALSMPVLLLHGKDDSFLPAPDEELLAKVTAAKTRGAFIPLVVPNFRHFPMLENVATFNRLVMDFLDADLTNAQLSVQLKETWRRQIR